MESGSKRRGAAERGMGGTASGGCTVAYLSGRGGVGCVDRAKEAPDAQRSSRAVFDRSLINVGN
jgi:hypothetical protein